MPDTTSSLGFFGSHRRPLKRLLGSAMIFLASLLLVASVGIAQDDDQDCDDFATQQQAQAYFDSLGPGDPDRLDADDDGVPCEDPEDEGDDSSQESVFESDDEDSVGGDQYEDTDRQQAVQTPQTGGPALLPLAGALMLLGSGGYFLVRR